MNDQVAATAAIDTLRAFVIHGGDQAEAERALQQLGTFVTIRTTEPAKMALLIAISDAEADFFEARERLRQAHFNYRSQHGSTP